MKNILLFCLLTGLLFGTQACKKDPNLVPSTSNIAPPTGGNGTDCLEGTEVVLTDLPAAIQDYLAANYPAAEADDAEKYDDNGTVTYEVDVEDTKLVFGANGNLLASLDETEVAPADLPAAVKAAIDAAYPGDTVEEAVNTLYYNGAAVLEVHLASGVELTFDANGNLLCTGQDDNDNGNNGGNDDNGNNDDDHHDGNEINLSDLSQQVQDMLNTLYSGYTPTHVELDTLCDGTAAIIIELKGANNTRLDAYFTTDGTLLYNATEIASANLPAAVTAAIAANYPGYAQDGHASKLELPGGTIQYEVELKNQAAQEDLDVIFATDGTVICEQQD